MRTTSPSAWRSPLQQDSQIPANDSLLPEHVFYALCCVYISMTLVIFLFVVCIVHISVDPFLSRHLIKRLNMNSENKIKHTNTGMFAHLWGKYVSRHNTNRVSLSPLPSWLPVVCCHIHRIPKAMVCCVPLVLLASSHYTQKPKKSEAKQLF